MAAPTKWIEIARAGGPYTALSGEAVSITRDDLDAAVASFDPADRRVPLVLGHPKLDDPAYGWLAAVKRDGDVLLARFDDVPDPLREAVDQGRYRNVSAKFAKGWRLWHVGLLGAAQPAIPGLAEVRLADETEGLIFEFAKEATMDELTRLKRELADATKALEETRRELAALKAAREGEGKAKELAAKIDELTQKLQAAEADRDKAIKEFAAFKDDQTVKGRENRFDALIAAGKALPGERPKVLAFAAALGSAGGEIELAAGDGKTEKLGHEEAYWRELEGRPENSLTHEFAAPAGAGGKAGGETADLTGKV
ncbi:phage protease [Solidesulfovibrio sp.]